ncbi:MAG TPA: hypothetical protein VGE29_08425 [Prosthecobacter sp.]
MKMGFCQTMKSSSLSSRTAGHADEDADVPTSLTSQPEPAA